MSLHTLADILRYADLPPASRPLLKSIVAPWCGHTVFVRVLMAEARPQLLVEPDARTGQYLSIFCRAMQSNAEPVRCCAVQASRNSADVEATPDTDNASAGMVEVLGADEALSRFAHESIDVLLINGLTPHEEVCRTFESWLPKVKPGGMVLLHAVGETAEDAGARRLWDDMVVQSTESYLFRHAHGLGVWRKPGGAPLETPLLAALMGKDPIEARLVDAYLTGLSQCEGQQLGVEKPQPSVPACEKKQFFAVAADLFPDLDLGADAALNKQADPLALLQQLALERVKLCGDVRRVQDSRSWKVTAPLRMAGHILRILKKWSALGKQYCRSRYDKIVKKNIWFKDEWRFRPESLQGNRLTYTCAQFVQGAMPTSAPVIPSLTETVDIIIPVYNGLDHLRRLLPALLANTTAPHRFIFIDDKSPDTAVWPWLQAQLAGRDDCLLLQNDENLGFPATVNRGAALSARNFVMLNTDTVVPVGWLERLMAPLAADATVASATPFSNAATIFSFPVSGDDAGNTAFYNAVGLEAINASLYAKAPADVPLHAPTGVGFCMAIARKAWDEFGGFDALRFGKGYGEENDWCQRTLRAGWKHVLAPNLYVFHAHGGSFAPATRSVQLDSAQKTINELYPDYAQSVQQHCERDPWEALRVAALLRLCADPARKAVLYLGHCSGGGAVLYLEHRLNKEMTAGRAALLMTFDVRSKEYGLSINIGAHRFNFRAVSPTDMLRADLSFLTAVVVNNLVGWPIVHQQCFLQTWIAELAEKNGAELEILFHDFYALCPRFTLLTPQNRFCNLPEDMAVCTRCANTASDMLVSMPVWRQQWQTFLDRCTAFLFFSNNTKELVSSVYTLAAERCRVVPHAPLHAFARPYVVPAHGPMRIVVVGSISHHKGAEIIQELSSLLLTRRPEVDIVIIGSFDGTPARNIVVCGRYNGEKLLEILESYKATVALFPSVWPETFSFVTHELCQMEMPLVCFDIGAPADHVRTYAHGLVAKEISAEAALQALEELDARRKHPR